MMKVVRYTQRGKGEHEMEVQQGGASHVLERGTTIAALAVLGIAGPIIFAVVALVQSVLRQDHSLVEHPISALAAGTSGWVQNVNFLLFGLLMIAFAVGLHLAVRPSRWGWVGLAFLVLSGMGLMVMSRRMAGDPRRKSVAAYALATGITMLVLILVGGGLVRPPGAPLHAWFGLFQWVLLAVWFPCTIILALRMLRLVRAADVPR